MAVTAVVKYRDFQRWSRCDMMQSVTKASHPMHWKVNEGINGLLCTNEMAATPL